MPDYWPEEPGRASYWSERHSEAARRLFNAGVASVYTFRHMLTAADSRSMPVRRRSLLCLAALVCSFALLALAPAARAQTKAASQLLIYAIDVEGGQSTLLVDTVTRASLLVDTGWPENDGRDAVRIQAAMSDAGITHIDHVLITHFHTDHVGGVPELVKRV